MTTHYEARLQKDLDWIEELVEIVGAETEAAIGNATRSVLTVDKDLAADTVLGDFLVNRQTRELDRLCHAFVARHLPSAGHLRFVSSVMRLAIALERIGDYAGTISRTAVQLSAPPPPVVSRDVEMMGEQARRLLHEAMRAFLARDVGLAQATITSASQFTHHFDKIFTDLVKEGDARSRPTNELFALMATFNRLDRVIHQAKNICEETIFVCTGRMKGERLFQLLFVDEHNDGRSQLAEHFTRKAFPQSGSYRSAGLAAKDEIDPAYVAFAQKNGMDLSKSWPTPLSSLAEQLAEFHVVICLHKGMRERLPRIPFHTTVLEWDLGAEQGPEAAFRELTPRIRDLLERLRGEHAC